jgi:DNA replication protein DnaC
MDHSPEQNPRSLDDVLGARQPDQPGTCPQHGPFVSRNVLGRIWTRCPECEATGRAERDAAEVAEQRRQAEQRHQQQLTTARIPTRFIGRSFENFVAETDAQRHALTVARSYAEDFTTNARRGVGLVMAGMPGTGKSHLAAAILQALFPRNVAYMTCMDVIRAVRETWRRDSERSETQVLRHLEQLDLLVIDEVGVQYGTDGEQTVLFDVLDRRYREVRPTVLLTNQDRVGFKTFIGERTFDRLAETTRWVPFDWASYRPTARKAAASPEGQPQ